MTQSPKSKNIAIKSSSARYPAYKDSGVDWLPLAPASWAVKRLRYSITLNPMKSEVRHLRGDTLVSLMPMEAVGEYGGLHLEQRRLLENVANGYTFFRNGDVLAAKITPCFENGKGALAGNLENGIGFGTTEPHVLRPGPGLNARYLFYLTLTDEFRKLGAAEMYGAGGQKRVPDSFIRELRHPIPSVEEQQAIAAFLDRETDRIDTLVAKKRRLIELLEEKRSVLISHAVTEGLDPNVKMKDSGIQGLGQIPVHWNKVAAKRVVSFITSGSRGWAEYYSDEGDLFIQSGNLDRELGLDLCNVQRVVPPHGAEVARTQVVRNDVLVCVTGAYTGNAGVVECDLPRAYVNQHVALVRPSRSVVCPKFLALVLASSLGQWHFKVSQYGATKQGLGLDDVMTAVLFMPPKDEMERLVVAVRNAIHRLQEYRTALISAAVTGKIDVRGEVDV